MLILDYFKKFKLKASEKPNEQNATPAEHSSNSMSPACEICPALFLSAQLTRESRGLEVVNESRIWYHDQYKRAVAFAIAVVAALLISLFLNTVQFFSAPPPKYFALTQDLRVVELTPLNKANLSQEKLLNWLSETIC